MFEYVLAKDLKMTRDQLKATMSNQEYVEWAAYYTWQYTQRKHQEDVARGRR